MNHSDHKVRHAKPSREGSTRSQEDQHIEEKNSSNGNTEDLEFASPTSAPPKLYTGSLFLYANDLFGCFANENQGTKEDDEYKKFFNTSKHTKDGFNKQASHSQGDLETLEIKNNENFTHMINETKSDLDASDMLSRQNSSLADARMSPDRLDPATNKAIIDIFEDTFHSTDGKGLHSDPHHHSKDRNHHNNNKHKMESKGYVSPRKQKENLQFSHPPMMVPPQMGYVQTPYMQMPSQPYVNMMPHQPYAYPLNDGYRRINQYPGSTYYPSYPNERAQAPSNFNNVVNKNTTHNHKTKREEPLKKEVSSNRKESYPQSNKKEKRTTDNGKQLSDNGSLAGDYSAKSSNLDPEDFENLIKNASKLAKDQTGCRMLQKEIEKEDPVVVNQIFSNIIQDFGQLMVDPFGNYLCQKLSEMCDNSQMKQIIEVISSDLAEICYNPHGTRVAQKLIEVVKDQNLIEMLVESLSKDVVGLVKDNNGNHVIQKCLTSMSDENKQFIYDSIVENCVEIATHKHGCCVIQRCLDHASKKQKSELAQVVAENALELVKDQYGNYVVQYVFELKDTELKIKKKIADELAGDLVELSKQKFSSNVVEKCLTAGVSNIRHQFMELMMDNDIIVDVICDKFANYVLQRFLANANEEEKTRILENISNNASSIKNDPFGLKIYSKICKNYNLPNDSDSLSLVSPQISENSIKTSTRQIQLKNETNRRNNNDSYKQPPRKQHLTKNGGEKRNNFNEVAKSRRLSNTNQQNGLPNGHFRGPIPGPMMYPPMRNDGLPPQNFGPNIMQSGYFMPQPQVYNQYFNYPAPQQGMYYPNIY